MKRLALVAAVLAIAACTTEKKAPASDTAQASMAPAAGSDTAMKSDTGMKGMAMDTTKKMSDTGMKKMDTKAPTKKP